MDVVVVVSSAKEFQGDEELAEMISCIVECNEALNGRIYLHELMNERKRGKIKVNLDENEQCFGGNWVGVRSRL